MPLQPFFSVNSYDLKSLSFKFGNDTFITFEMPSVSYRRPVGKMNISLLFRPSVIRGPWFIRLYFTKSCDDSFCGNFRLCLCIFMRDVYT